jgi:hypothetical protein
VADRPSFQEIRSFFRETDVESMEFVFDLSSYDDVREYSEEIYARVAEGTMPCDEPWPDERVQRLRQWIDAGMPS